MNGIDIKLGEYFHITKISYEIIDDIKTSIQAYFLRWRCNISFSIISMASFMAGTILLDGVNMFTSTWMLPLGIFLEYTKW